MRKKNGLSRGSHWFENVCITLKQTNKQIFQKFKRLALWRMIKSIIMSDERIRHTQNYFHRMWVIAGNFEFLNLHLQPVFLQLVGNFIISGFLWLVYISDKNIVVALKRITLMCNYVFFFIFILRLFSLLNSLLAIIFGCMCACVCEKVL